uniref:Anaphase-promoting complex subunit 4 WD40 domain-containing protein n=1 Tax=Alexandrium monilatum TaxID=311494 RepID=A0A7S4UIF3_9DINO
MADTAESTGASRRTSACDIDRVACAVGARRVTPKFALPDAESEVFCVRFSTDDVYLGAACANGAILIYNALTGRRSFTLNSGQEHALPTTQLRWRPQQSLSKTKNVLVCVSADGRIQHWHASSGKLLQEIPGEGDRLFCVDYSPDGASFATAGKRREVRVYDESTKTLSQVLRGGDSVNTSGHANRVFSLKYHPTMREVLVSGGWDSTVQFWDLRQGHAVRAIFGPHVCGDAVDISQDGASILTGSWRVEKQLQIWDFRSERLLDTLPWRDGVSLLQPCMVYAAQFSKSDGSLMLAAGGSGANEVKLFDRRNGGAAVGTVAAAGLTHACYTLDFSNSGSMLAIGGGDGCVRVFSVHPP